MIPDSLRVAVVGGGIGGLVCAIALGRLGVNEKLTTAQEPTYLQFRRWDSAELIWSHPVGKDGWYREHCGAPYYGIHRKDLLQAFIETLGPQKIHLSHKCIDVAKNNNDATLTFENGESASADIVVAADGIHSPSRRHIAGEAKAVFSRDVGFRGVIPVEKLPSLPEPGAIQFWPGPNGHILHYAIEGGSVVNFLAVVDRSEWTEHRCKTEATVEEVLTFFEGWHPAVREMVGSVTEEPAWWALHDLAPLNSWSSGRVVLIGDAAHAMLPHQGQGANQAIEDAVALAHILSEDGHNYKRAFGRYESLRMKRTRRAQLYSRIPARYLHLPNGLKQERRDARIQSLDRDIAWLHTYDVEGEFAVSAGDRGGERA